jgi:hypothetical protein
MQPPAAVLQPGRNPAYRRSVPSTAPGGRRKEEAVSSRHHRALRRLVSLIAAAALAAPMTAAAAGGSGSSVRSSPEVYTDPAVVARHKALGLLGRQNAAPRIDSSQSRTVESPAPVVVRVDGGFDWVSAGVGAAGGLGLAVVLAGATSTMRRRPRGDQARV